MKKMKQKMKVIWISEELHDRLRTQAYLTRTTMQSLVEAFVQNGLDEMVEMEMEMEMEKEEKGR